MESYTYKDAVIVGNGPSAITLSYMLAGNWPYYNGFPHSFDFLQYRLQENKDKSLLEQDLCSLSEGLEGRSLNPVSVLFDTLSHPNADLGVDLPSVIEWRNDPERRINHVVLGKGVPGGSWQKMDGSTLTISLGSWMELPNLSILDWNKTINRLRCGSSGLRQKRASVRTVADYYHYYVCSKNLNPYFVDNAVVTSVSPFDVDKGELYSEKLWLVDGFMQHPFLQQNEHFSFITSHVVLATGNSDESNKLDVIGEDLPFVLYSLSELEDLIRKGSLSPNSGSLLIVGAGLSAADGIIAARFHGINAIHVFRRSVCDPDLIFNKLPQNIYPEYHKVHQMMQNSVQGCYEGYKAFPSSKVQSIQSDGTVTIVPCSNDGVTAIVKVSYVLVLIGMHPDLSFLPDRDLNLGIKPMEPVNCKSNSVDIELYSHECVHYPGIYAVGPLVGDNFVRFVQGGCLAVARQIALHSKRIRI